MPKIKIIFLRGFFYIFIFGFVALIWISIIKALSDLPNSIKSNETYMKYFDTEKYDELKRLESLLKQKILEIKKKECAILIQAKKDIIPLKIERYVLNGRKLEDATRLATYDLSDDELKCEKYGIAPYEEVID